MPVIDFDPTLAELGQDQPLSGFAFCAFVSGGSEPFTAFAMKHIHRLIRDQLHAMPDHWLLAFRALETGNFRCLLHVLLS